MDIIALIRILSQHFLLSLKMNIFSSLSIKHHSLGWGGKIRHQGLALIKPNPDAPFHEGTPVLSWRLTY